jgi:uncharacterized protein (UPF0332 family)
MATWHDIAKGNEEAAKVLLKGDHWRSAVSRAYFAAYSDTTGRLQAQGLDLGPRSNPAHAALPELIEGNLAGLKDWERRDLKSRTRRLYAARCAADYEASAAIGVVEARQGLTDLAIIGRLLAGGGAR